MPLNGFIAAMAPDHYTAPVWQHFSEPENGCNFVQRLLIEETTLQILMDPKAEVAKKCFYPVLAIGGQLN